MKKQIMLVGISLLCLVIGMPLAAEPSNAEAKEIIAEMTAAMNLLAERVEKMSSPEDFVQVCEQYAETVETYGKKMYTIIKANPEWGENPPDEMKETLTKYSEALLNYGPALNTITKYANDHSENEAVQAAMKRLNTAVYQMYK